jgi:cobalt-zinc-cadmium efflux system membrane fusion protein
METNAEIEMVTPFVDESTRSATARVVLDNKSGNRMPGTFVTAFSSTSEVNLPVVVAKSSVQNIEGHNVVFIEDEDGFEMKPVTLGRSDRKNVEIITGLEPGTDYVSTGAFQLKATVVTSSLGGHAGHGH